MTFALYHASYSSALRSPQPAAHLPGEAAGRTHETLGIETASDSVVMVCMTEKLERAPMEVSGCSCRICG